MVETTDPVYGTEYRTDEFEALREMLDAEGIEWHDNSDSVFHRTQGEHGGRRFSAIFGYGSYGHEHGFLEVRMDETEPIGWLTAKQALDLIAGNSTDSQALEESKNNWKAERDRYFQALEETPWKSAADERGL